MAKKNVKMGPITQFNSKEMERILVFLKTVGKRE